MDLTKSSITTERLLLVPLSQEYAHVIFDNFTHEITTYMFPAAPKRIDDTLAYINEQLPKIQSGENFHVVILEKTTQKFLGGAGISTLTSATPELGIWIKKTAHGHHYGREAIHGLKQWADAYLTYDYLIYPVDKRNIPSRKIAESLGGVIAKEYKKENMSGKLLDEIEYHIYKTHLE
jgi:RimJ/RimL family protein N-acetyltransferase